MPQPEECQSLAEVRAEIDAIDEQIVTLLGRRAGYVHAAARFKKSAGEVAAPERQASMFQVRRAWAAREGLDADFIEQVFQIFLTYFVAREAARWKSL